MIDNNTKRNERIIYAYFVCGELQSYQIEMTNSTIYIHQLELLLCFGK